MNEITQIRKLSLWIFFLPLIAINLCLLISQNPLILDNTIFKVDMIGRSAFTIPYLDGSLSISRASRTYPQYLIFKPAMIVTAILLYYYWINNNLLINKYRSTNISYKFKTFGILSAFFLVIHSNAYTLSFILPRCKCIYTLLYFYFLFFFLLFFNIWKNIRPCILD